MKSFDFVSLILQSFRFCSLILQRFRFLQVCKKSYFLYALVGYCFVCFRDQHNFDILSNRFLNCRAFLYYLESFTIFRYDSGDSLVWYDFFDVFTKADIRLGILLFTSLWFCFLSWFLQFLLDLPFHVLPTFGSLLNWFFNCKALYTLSYALF